MSRLPPHRRESTDRLLLDLLKDGERRVRDVLAAFADAGYNLHDYRASRSRIGTTVRKGDGEGKARVWYVRVQDGGPNVNPGPCGPPRSGREVVRNFAPEIWDDIGRQKRYLADKIKEVEGFLEKLRPERALYARDSLAEERYL